MLDQYIINRLKDHDEKIKKLAEKLKGLQMEEESSYNMIQKLVEQEDVGIELFSPRSSNDTTRTKVADIKKEIEDIKLQQMKVNEEIEQRRAEATKYQAMLEEIKSKEAVYKNNKPYREPTKEMRQDSSVKNIEELKTILIRVDKCLSLLNKNRNQCKSELQNLKYYLKALISNK